jgi:hypothetical protein
MAAPSGPRKRMMKIQYISGRRRMKWMIANIWSNKPQGYSRWLRNPMRYKDSVKGNICGIEPEETGTGFLSYVQGV